MNTKSLIGLLVFLGLPFLLGLRYPQPLAGIIALSTYLALPQQLSHETSESNKSIPIFMAHGIADPIIPVEQGRDSCDQLKQAGYPVDWNEYTMQHAVCLQEIEAIGSWIKDKLA